MFWLTLALQVNGAWGTVGPCGPYQEQTAIQPLSAPQQASLTLQTPHQWITRGMTQHPQLKVVPYHRSRRHPSLSTSPTPDNRAQSNFCAVLYRRRGLIWFQLRFCKNNCSVATCCDDIIILPNGTKMDLDDFVSVTLKGTNKIQRNALYRKMKCEWTQNMSVPTADVTFPKNESGLHLVIIFIIH